MQRMWGIGNSWRISSQTQEGGACAEGAMTHLREVNLWYSDFTWHKGTKWRTGGLVLWKLGTKDWSQNPAILIRRNRFVHFFIDLSTLVYFFRCGCACWSGKEGFRCYCSKCTLNLRKLWWRDYTRGQSDGGYLDWSNLWRIPWLQKLWVNETILK